MGCCGGGRRTVAPAARNAQKGAQAQIRVGETGMILVEYIGENVGRTVLRGQMTQQRYEFSGARRKKYVDKRDVAGLLGMRYGKQPMFRVAPPEPGPAPATEEAPAAALVAMPPAVLAVEYMPPVAVPVIEMPANAPQETAPMAGPVDAPPAEPKRKPRRKKLDA